MVAFPKETVESEQISSTPAAWVDLYADSLYNFALVRVGDRDVAEELVQETFSVAIGAFYKNQFDKQASPKTWLTGILKHKIMDYFRNKYRHKALALDRIGEDEIEESFDASGKWRIKPGNWAANPFEQYEHKELMQYLITCLKTLRERQAFAIRLRELEEKNVEEICKTLTISATNYYVLMHRARLALRQCMERHLNR